MPGPLGFPSKPLSPVVAGFHPGQPSVSQRRHSHPAQPAPRTGYRAPSPRTVPARMGRIDLQIVWWRRRVSAPAPARPMAASSRGISPHGNPRTGAQDQHRPDTLLPGAAPWSHAPVSGDSHTCPAVTSLQTQFTEVGGAAWAAARWRSLVFEARSQQGARSPAAYLGDFSRVEPANVA